MSPRHYATVAAAIRHLEAHREEQPSLDELAHAVGLSPGHLQRVFTAWAGISPKRFLQALTKAHARTLLAASRRSFDAALEAGLSGGGRLHDLFVECEAVTPGEVARQGSGLVIAYGFTETPFGTALIGQSPRGICHLRFVDGAPGMDGTAVAEAELATEWPLATRRRDDDGARLIARTIFADAPDRAHAPAAPLALWLKGTNFQLQVWQALLRLPAGWVTTYGELARKLGKPGAARAVGSAVGANPVGWLIPCHRVIRETGALGGYRWGLVRKRAMLVREESCREIGSDSGRAGGRDGDRSVA